MDSRRVVTAYHVAAQGAEFRLEFLDGSVVNAKVLVAHPEVDIAVLIADRDLPASARGMSGPPGLGGEGYVVGYRPGYNEPPAVRPSTFYGAGGPLALAGPRPGVYSTLLFDSSAGGGDSGGAMLTPSGSLFGIIVGGSTDPATGRILTHVVPASLVRAVLG